MSVDVNTAMPLSVFRINVYFSILATWMFIFTIIMIHNAVVYTTGRNLDFGGGVHDIPLRGQSREHHNAHVKGLKKILLWNPFFGEPDYGVGGFGTAAFEITNCEHTCYTTNDQSQLSEADAVIIHTYNIGSKHQNITLPKRTNEKQIFVFFILESPKRSYKGFTTSGMNLTDIFNLTFSFLDSPDTDIYIPMGGLQRRAEPDERSAPRINKIKQKTKMVAWFVSNCNAPSARYAYARKLSRYVSVDIYGSCGNLTCPPGNMSCYVNIVQNYMFYLAFENSFCQDYATEKLFRTLNTPMVPIVYGHANYTKLLPQKSFIDVRDYSSPGKLAKYLHLLKKYPSMYMRYVSWKRDYTVLMEGDYKAMGFCRLCSILHNDSYVYKSGYNPVHDYWNPRRLCLTRQDEKREVHLA